MQAYQKWNNLSERVRCSKDMHIPQSLKYARSLYPNLGWRLLYLTVGVAVIVFSFYAGLQAHLTLEDAKNIVKQLQPQIKSASQINIFMNNIWIGLSIFIPGFGVMKGIWSSFNTGLAANALGLVYHLERISLFEWNTSYGLVEIFADGLAISRSGMIVYQLVQRRSFKEYFIPAIVDIVIVIVLLLVGSFIEMYTIQHQRTSIRN